MTAENKHNKKLERLGFSFERGGVHTARTMMLVELRTLLSFVGKRPTRTVLTLRA